MKGKILCAAVMAVTVIGSGCVVRTYEYTQKRVDQNLVAGNRGFITGNAPSAW